MQFALTSRQVSTRSHVREFLSRQESLWTESEFKSEDEQWEIGLQFNAALAAEGWIAPAWPTKYGGKGLSFVEQAIVKEEFELHGAPDAGRVQGVGLAGPTIILHGTE